MTPSTKHGLLAVICLIGAGALLVAAVVSGVRMIDSLESPTRILLNHLVEQTGKATEQNILKPDTDTQIRVAIIIAILAAAAGVGLARAFEELSKLFLLIRKERKESCEKGIRDASQQITNER